MGRETVAGVGVATMGFNVGGVNELVTWHPLKISQTSRNNGHIVIALRTHWEAIILVSSPFFPLFQGSVNL
jgi:hypothetical protein